jgi:5'/3'-nucleotidase SurE
MAFPVLVSCLPHCGFYREQPRKFLQKIAVHLPARLILAPVFAGINHGANLGDDVLYSGTVAAATEGRFLGLPAVAISMVSSDPQHFETAVKAAGIILQRLLDQPLAKDILLNINVPDLPMSCLSLVQNSSR